MVTRCARFTVATGKCLTWKLILPALWMSDWDDNKEAFTARRNILYEKLRSFLLLFRRENFLFILIPLVHLPPEGKINFTKDSFASTTNENIELVSEEILIVKMIICVPLCCMRWILNRAIRFINNLAKWKTKIIKSFREKILLFCNFA